MSTKSALGRGLGSLIPQGGINKSSSTEPQKEETQKKSKTQEPVTGVLEIEVTSIKENPRQPRYRFDQSGLDDLMSSIKEHGILQPLVVTKVAGGYELIAGERRLRASRAIGMKTVPVVLREAGDQTKLELALIENIQRQDLNAVEEAMAYQALHEEFNLTQEEVAKRVGKSRSSVANILRLLDLPDTILDALKDGRISKSHARTLLAEPDEKRQKELFNQMLNGGVTVREAEARVTSSGSRSGARGATKKDPNILAHEKRLREILGTKVDIKESSGKGKISISFYSREELLELLDQLSGF